jgi:exonuclease III
MNNHIQILSMNVRGLISNTKKRLDVFNWVNAKKISIVCFQETHSTKDGSQMGGQMGYCSKCFFSHGDSKNGFDLKVNDSILHQNGRHIILDLTVYEQRLYIYN